MAKTLIASKPILEQDLYKAFFDAYMTQFQGNTVPEASKYDGEMQKAMQEKADKFSKTLSKEMADAIYNFVKEISIQATVTGTIIAPSGPCTGALPPTSFTIT